MCFLTVSLTDTLYPFPRRSRGSLDLCTTLGPEILICLQSTYRRHAVTSSHIPMYAIELTGFGCRNWTRRDRKNYSACVLRCRAREYSVVSASRDVNQEEVRET